jgi:hypothetical protein
VVFVESKASKKQSKSIMFVKWRKSVIFAKKSSIHLNLRENE